MLPRFPLCRQCTHLLAAVLSANRSRLHTPLESGLSQHSGITREALYHCPQNGLQRCKMLSPLPLGGTNSEVELLIQSPLCNQAEVHLHGRPCPRSALPPAPCPPFSWEPSVNHMHLSLCFQGNQPKSSQIFLSFHKLNWNSICSLQSSVRPCAFVLPRTKIPDTLFLSHVGWLYHHSEPTFCPKASWACHDWRCPVSRKRKIHQFILQHGSARLGSTSRALWERNV